MPRIKGTTGTGITKKGIVQFDWDNASDVSDQISAALRSFNQTSFSPLSRELRQHAIAILSADSLPGDTTARYTDDAKPWQEEDGRQGREPLELWQLLSGRGFAEDSAAGYAVRLLYLLNEVDALALGKRHDDALAKAFDAGQLVAEAAIKEIWEKDALRGYKVIESAREGHTARHGTAQAKAVRRALHIKAFEKFRSQGLGKTAACEAAGEECGVTGRTIQRSVTGK